MDLLHKVYHRRSNPARKHRGPLARREHPQPDPCMSDLAPAHMQHRTTLSQLVSYSVHCTAIYLPVPPSHVPGHPELIPPSLPTINAGKRGPVAKWKMCLKWVEGNPLEIEERDNPVLIARIKGLRFCSSPRQVHDLYIDQQCQEA